jgi:UDP-N-acetylglucosamine acyltransferase
VARVHPTAVVDPAAKLADDAEVGPYSVVGGEVELGRGVVVGPHVVLTGRTRVGARTRISPFCVIGAAPQILGAVAGTTLRIGADNVIREYASLHCGSVEGGAGTRVGDGNLLLHGTHVAHDCRVGSACVLGSQASLAGHVAVEDHAVLGAQVGVHQFCRIGESAFVAAVTKLPKDAPPFARVMGHRRPRFAGLNTVGLERRGFGDAVIATLRHAYHVLSHSRLLLAPALDRVRAEWGGCAEVARLLAFFEGSQRGVIR